MVEDKIYKTGIYLRVSTEEQAREGFSIHAQKEKLTSYANINDWEIYDFYIDDGISGKNITDRPSINRLIEDVKCGNVNNVLIYKLDRLTRSVKDLINLIELFEEYNCSFNSVTEKLDTSNAVGRMFIKIIGIFAEFERENLAERVSFGYEQKTREGNYTNTNGVNGYDYIVGSGELVVNILEKDIVNRIYDLYLEGNSMIKIAKQFNEEKVPTKRGGDWSQATIKSILTNPLYIGKIRYGVGKKNQSKAFKVDGTQECIIDEEKFYKTQEVMKKRKHYCNKKFPSEKAYFTTALRCHKCGAKFHPKMSKQANGDKIYITYYCNNRQLARCESSGISHIKVLNAFEDYINNITLKPRKDLFVSNNESKKEESILKEIDKLDTKRKKLQSLFINEEITSNDYQDMIKIIDEKKEFLKTSLNDLKAPKQEEINLLDIQDIITDFKRNWDYLNTSERNSFITQFIKKIDLDVIDGKAVIEDIQFV